MKYQLIVKNTSTKEIMTGFVTSKKHYELEIEVSDLANNLVEVIIAVNIDSSKVNEFEDQLNETVFDPESNVIDWKKLD